MAQLSLSSKYKMLSGYEIPVLGFGTAASPEKNFTIGHEKSVAANVHALKCGYRHFDSARLYNSERACGEAIRASGLPRGEVFVTTKVFEAGYEKTKQAVEASLQETGLEYIDLYLNHGPYGGPEVRKGTWRALVEAQKEGKVRSIGVSNYGVHHLEETLAYIEELEGELGKGNAGELSVGQWELHPWLAHPDIVEWCRKHGVVVEAYCPLAKGQRFEEPAVKALADKYGKSGAQVLLRWSLQKGFVPLPKSETPARIESNADVFDFELTEEDMALLEFDSYAPTTWDPTVSPLDN
ncbi:Aldo/keto reductase [Trichoderma citrinoviride]|uniref:Aldo/keto reductase n=1 Tax=Trichoderma citrinoviride TaxID=58853 RepID=A0A2T4BJ39_9HYPO|nr:Aldo/keto reductase [Trichoderma citrinoviride]PTB69336.1 Aldo/keto reductase [Trichoderma citrinoviride]